MTEFECGLEICLFCDGKRFTSKKGCGWIQANAHCKCCWDVYGVDRCPCVQPKKGKANDL